MQKSWLQSAMGYFLLTTVGFLAPTNIHAEQVDPFDLMKQSDKRHRLSSERFEGTMLLQKLGGQSTLRRFYNLIAQDDQKGDKSIFGFLSPANIKDTAMLSVENRRGGDDEQWLYLPSFRKTRRIGASELGDRFVGTDLFNEDLKRRKVEDYGYQLKGSEKFQEQECWVIEQSPKAPRVVKDSPYGKGYIWLRKDILFVVKMKLFDRKMKPIKEVVFDGLKNVGAGVFRADKITVTDVQRKHRTVITVEKRTVNFPLEADSFSQHKLSIPK